MTQEELEKRLDMIKYYDLSNKMWQENIDGSKADHIPALKAALIKVANESIKRNNLLKAGVIKLLDYAASESDKDVLYRYYVDHQSYFDIAESAHYSYSYIMSKRANAFHRLAVNLQEYPAIIF